MQINGEHTDFKRGAVDLFVVVITVLQWSAVDQGQTLNRLAETAYDELS